MATGGGEYNLESEFAVVSGSEAIFDHVCQPCSDEMTQEAVGFCVDCAEWLCDECFNVHTKPKPSKHHVLRKLKEMKNFALSTKPKDECSERCDHHNGKRLKYYCSVHDFFGCSLCVIQSHKTCMVSHIPDVCESTDTEDEFKQVTDKLEAIAKRSEDIRSEINEQKEQVKTNNIETVNAIQCYIKKLIEALRDIGTSLEETCQKRTNEETKKLANAASVCKDVEKESFSIKTHLETLHNTGQHINVFVALKRSKKKLATLESKKKQLTVTTRLYTFKPNVAVESTITGAGGIGKLVEQDTCLDYSKIQARHIDDISITSQDKNRCCIVGATLLSPNKLIVADCGNKQVSHIDTKNYKMTSGYQVNGRPRGINKAGDNSVVVTLWDKHKLLFLSVDDMGTFSETNTIPLQGQCMGVTVFDNKMIVTYICPAKIQIMDTRGSVLQTLTVPKICFAPISVVVGLDKTSLYISDHHNTFDTFACVNLDGTLIASYTDKELLGPEQAAVDRNGMVFLAGCNSNNVHLLTPDCKKVKVILNENDGLKEAHAVSYCDKTQRLYVGSRSDVIKVFQLKS